MGEGERRTHAIMRRCLRRIVHELMKPLYPYDSRPVRTTGVSAEGDGGWGLGVVVPVETIWTVDAARTAEARKGDCTLGHGGSLAEYGWNQHGWASKEAKGELWGMNQPEGWWAWFTSLASQTSAWVNGRRALRASDRRVMAGSGIRLYAFLFRWTGETMANEAMSS
jgi:hypothetical protein